MRNLVGLIVLTTIILLLPGCGRQQSTTPLLTTPPSAAVDNDIYVADDRGRIRAFRPDGSEQWTISLPDEITRRDSTESRDIRIDFLTARSAGKLFGLATQLSGSHTGSTILFALDANHLLWQIEAPYPEQNGAALAIGSDAIYEAAQDGVLYAFSRLDGKQVWKYQVSQGPLGSPTVSADGTIYVTGPNYNLHAITPDGKQRWVRGTQS
jgi:outer membrane protein assembly factor BamB